MKPTPLATLLAWIAFTKPSAAESLSKSFTCTPEKCVKGVSSEGKRVPALQLDQI